MIEEDYFKNFITLEDIKTVFGCEDDKARKIMNNPDLEKFPVGKEWRVRRDLWMEFIDNVIKFGLQDLSRGFKVMTGTQRGPSYAFLLEVGLTDEQIIRGYNIVKEEGQKDAEQH